MRSPDACQGKSRRYPVDSVSCISSDASRPLPYSTATRLLDCSDVCNSEPSHFLQSSSFFFLFSDRRENRRYQTLACDRVRQSTDAARDSTSDCGRTHDSSRTTSVSAPPARGKPKAPEGCRRGTKGCFGLTITGNRAHYVCDRSPRWISWSLLGPKLWKFFYISKFQFGGKILDGVKVQFRSNRDVWCEGWYCALKRDTKGRVKK